MIIAPDRLDYERWLELFRACLGAAAFAEAWARGQSMALGEALATVADRLRHD